MAGTVSPDLPTIGTGRSTADTKIRSSLVTLRDALNAVLDASNNLDGADLATGTVTNTALAGSIAGSKLLDDAVTPAKLGTVSSAAACTPDLALGTSFADVANCTYTTASAGDFLVWGVFDFTINLTSAVGTDIVAAVGNLLVDGVAQGGEAVLVARTGLSATEGSARATVSQVWRVASVAISKVIKLQAKRINLVGTPTYTGTCKATNSTLTVLQIG